MPSTTTETARAPEAECFGVVHASDESGEETGGLTERKVTRVHGRPSMEMLYVEEARLPKPVPDMKMVVPPPREPELQVEHEVGEVSTGMACNYVAYLGETEEIRGCASEGCNAAVRRSVMERRGEITRPHTPAIHHRLQRWVVNIIAIHIGRFNYLKNLPSVLQYA
jgi:hypothetical protein